MLQHHSVLARTWWCDHQPLSRLAQGKRALVVLHREVRCHDSIYVVTSGSGFPRVLRTPAIVCAASPQRSDVIVGQIHVITDIHDPKASVSSSLSVSQPTGHSANTAALWRADLTPKGKHRKNSNQYQRVQVSVQIPKVYSLTGMWCRNWQLNQKHSEKLLNCGEQEPVTADNHLVMFSVVKWPHYQQKGA